MQLSPGKKRNKTPADPSRQKAGLLWYIIGMVVILSIYRIVISVVAHLRLFDSMERYQRHTQSLATFLLMLMMGLLWLAYRQWRVILHERDQLETILASIEPDMILAVDCNNRILRCGGAIQEMSGYQPEELSGKPAGLLYHDRRNSGQGYEIQAALEKSGFYVGYTSGCTKDGENYLLEMQISRLRSLHGGAVILLRNLDERQHARLQLQRRIRMEELFAELSARFLQADPQHFNEACLTALKEAADLFGYQSAAAGFLDPQTGSLRALHYWSQNRKETSPAFRQALAEAAASADTGEQMAFRFPENAEQAPAPLTELHRKWNIHAAVFSPMNLQGRPAGFLALLSEEPTRRRAPEDTTVLKALTSTLMAGELNLQSN